MMGRIKSFPDGVLLMPRAKARVRDWVFGSPGKRRLLEVLLGDEGRPWSQTELASAAGMHPKGSADEHLLALAQIGLVDVVESRYRLRAEHALVDPLRALLHAVADLPDTPVRRPGD